MHFQVYASLAPLFMLSAIIIDLRLLEHELHMPKAIRREREGEEERERGGETGQRERNG